MNFTIGIIIVLLITYALIVMEEKVNDGDR
jgi:hypothetical protein